MAVSVMARCGTGLGASFGAPRRVRAQPSAACRPPVSFVRIARPKMSPAQAFYRGGCGGYNNFDEEAMKVSSCCCWFSDLQHVYACMHIYVMHGAAKLIDHFILHHIWLLLCMQCACSSAWAASPSSCCHACMWQWGTAVAYKSARSAVVPCKALHTLLLQLHAVRLHRVLLTHMSSSLLLLPVPPSVPPLPPRCCPAAHG